MLLERGLEREGNRSVFWKGQDQNLLGHRLATSGIMWLLGLEGSLKIRLAQILTIWMRVPDRVKTIR